MITGKVIGGEKVVEKLKEYPKLLDIEMRKGVARAALLVLKQTVENKLNKPPIGPPAAGGPVLSVRTGRLRRSINASPVKSDGFTISATVGTNVSYGRTHEYGFQGTVNVREALRVAKKSGKAFMVSAHTRKVNMPERSFLRSALKDMQLEIRKEFENAVAQVNFAISGR